jgi:hypothetical protein
MEGRESSFHILGDRGSCEEFLPFTTLHLEWKHSVVRKKVLSLGY